jgi:hypothetical protein
MTRPDFDPTWLLDLAKDSEDLFKKTLGVMLDAHREEAAIFERERIIALIESLDAETWMGANLQIADLLKGDVAECECDPCDNEDCKCRMSRCDYCMGNE